MDNTMITGYIKNRCLMYFALMLAIGSLLFICESSFAGIESDVIPQVYDMDNFQDDIPVSNFPKYFPTGGLGSDMTDPDNAMNKVRQINWDSFLPDQWWYSDTWNGVDDNTVLDATYYSHLVFKVRGTAGGEDFRVELQDQSGNVIQGDATYFVENVTPEWQEVWIPISYFAGNGTPENPGIDLKRVKAVAFTFYDIPTQPTGTVYIDDLRFTGCVIDNFNDALPGMNTLRKSTDTVGSGITGLDETGGHKIVWDYPGSGDKPYWYTNTEFASLYAGFNPAFYNYLHFRIRGLSGGEEFKIDYHTPSTFASINTKDYFATTTAWQDIYLPLKLFTDQGVTRDQLNGLALRFGEAGDSQAGTIYIDDIELKYVKHDPIITTGNKDFYKDHRRGFHIKTYEPDGDALVYSAENMPAGAAVDEKTGMITWKPGTLGAYPITLIAREDRKDAAAVSKNILINVLTYAGSVKDPSSGTVRLNGRELMVNEAPFKIKGVGYQPVPIGGQPGGALDPLLFERDLPVLAAMGCNTIRTWGDPGDDLLLSAQSHGLKVCAGYWVDYGLDPSIAAIRTDLKSGFRAFVARLKGNPAILLWAIGNENNYHPLQNKKEWYSLVNEMAQEAYIEEGALYHPVAVVNGNLHNMGDMDMFADDAALPYVDLWGSNIYPGHSFDGLFDAFAELSDKPLWISEYGVDAYYTTAWHYDGENIVVDSGYLDTQAQAEWDANTTVEILASNIAIGGTIMAYSDEWWKAVGIPYGNPSLHEPGGFLQDFTYENALVPDRFMNEEYWGIVSVSPDGGDTDTLDDITLRPVYYKLKDVFTDMPFAIVRPGESIQAALDAAQSGEAVYVEDGLYD
ncbi:MAG: hypothetical protein Q8R48_05635, partial [Candidatus Omnitrophota bacterium]|nr:hypothetical protein [Candidatus Omnitrophota bacterium]